jgi:hypothetical protein
MSGYYSPRIVTDGLVLYYDFANTKCYSGSGSSVNSLTGNYSATLYNSPAFSQANGGSIIMDGINDYMEVTSVSTGTSRTVDIVYKLLNPSYNWGPLWRTNDWKEKIFPSNVTLINSTTTYYNLVGPLSNTEIVNVCYSYSGTNLRCYRNGIKTDTQTMSANMDTGNFTYRFGNQAGGATNAFVNMHLYSVKFYDRQLADDEVLRNFESIKGRYSL